MATQDRSPSLFLGQSWASWADKMSITDGRDDEDEEKADAKDDGDCMKLNKKDMDLFGYCPSRDEFLLVQCEACSMLLKPQALKRHVEIRHGPVAAMSSSEQTITSKALHSELAKTLSLPVSSFGKTSTTNKPPTKASLKQVPSSIRLLNNSASSGGGENANCRINSSRMFRKGNTNPVVKMERIPREVASFKKMTTATPSASNSPSVDVTSSSSFPATTAPILATSGMTVISSDSGKTVMGGAMLKQALRTSLSSVTTLSTTAVTTLATPALTLTTTTTSITYTRPTTAAVPTTTTTTSLTVFSKSSKPVPTAALSSALAATLTAATTSPVKSSTHSTVTSTKSKKSPKERKLLPCKDREFDPNKHCGVVTDDTARPCTRSLTCKTHALGLRRAVPGRKKSFDDLLKDHKAAKEAMLKAKAEEQAAANGGIVTSPKASCTIAPTLVSAVTSPAALAAFRLGAAELSVHRDVKSATTALLSKSALPRSVKPQRGAFSAVFQKLTPGGILPASVTVKEEASPVGDLSSRLSQSSESSFSQSSDKDGENKEDKQDITFLSQHPRPAAECTFGARKARGGCALISRRTDLVRSAFLSALERQLNPPPHKKLCVESKLPKEPQMSINSKDPYEFNMVDSGLAHQRPTVSFTISGPVNANSGLIGKPLLKHKAKSLSSHSLNVTGLTVSSGMSATPTTIAIPTLPAALLKPIKGPETSSGSTITGLPRGAVSLSQSLSGQSVKRKRSGSSQISSSPASGTLQLQGTGVGLAVAAAPGVNLANIDGVRVCQQQSTVLTPVSGVNSQSATTPLTAITIPSINLANAATLGLSAALPTSKQGPGQKASIVKDFSLVLTGIDPSLVNGQYLNITGTQLAELAAVQAVNATAEDKNIKRSRLASTKHGTHKISGTLETLRALHGSNVLTAVPPNAVLVDGTLQGAAVLAPVSLSGGGGNGGGTSTLVTLTSSAVTTTQSVSSITVTPNTIFRTVSESGTPQQVTLSTASFANGIIPSQGDKVHMTTGSSASSQQHRFTNSLQGQAGSTVTAKTLQASGLLQAQGTPLCPTTGLAQLAHFKPGTLNITKGGKITMQPVSVTIPVVNTMGLSTIPATQQPNAHPHPQPALLVTTSTEDGRAGGGVAGVGKTEIHIQPHISSASSGVIS